MPWTSAGYGDLFHFTMWVTDFKGIVRRWVLFARLQPFSKSLCVDSACPTPSVTAWVYVLCVSCDGLGTSPGCIPAGIDSSTPTTLISRNMMGADAEHMRSTVSPSASVCSRMVSSKTNTVMCFYFISSAGGSDWDGSDAIFHYIKHTHTRSTAGRERCHCSDSHLRPSTWTSFMRTHWHNPWILIINVRFSTPQLPNTSCGHSSHLVCRDTSVSPWYWLISSLMTLGIY